MTLTRRHVIGTSAAAASALAAPTVKARTRPKIGVVGGGASGALQPAISGATATVRWR